MNEEGLPQIMPVIPVDHLEAYHGDVEGQRCMVLKINGRPYAFNYAATNALVDLIDKVIDAVNADISAERMIGG